jgi:hypothetical protein
MYNWVNSSPTISNCTFSLNLAYGYSGQGGGMYNFDSSPTISNCTFSINLAYGYGGQGGGMFSEYFSSPKLTGCTFTGNYAILFGGGMYNEDYSDPIVTNCTFRGNLAEYGGGMFNYFDSNPTVTNCILWGNIAASAGNEILDQFSTPLISYSNIAGSYPGSGNIDADPLFVDADGVDDTIGTEDDNLRLLPGSPCIDAGDSNSVGPDLTDLDDDGNTTEPIPWDLDGHDRFIDDPCTPDTGIGTPPIVDMGAYEFSEFCGSPIHPYPTGDINSDCKVDIIDAVILALAWLSEDGGIGWDPDCEIGIPADGIISWPDFSVLGAHWLECTKPDCD